MRDGTAGRGREYALSEVVGFVLLIAVIISAFSLYLIYSVPAQGRDNEIRHMDEVKDEFVAYKLGVDLLWTNDQTDNTISTTIKPGTSGATMSGSSGFLPIVQPIASSGTVAINRRTPIPEQLSIVSYSYMKNETNRKTDVPLPITISQVQQPYPNSPDSLFINISVNSNIGPTADPYRAVVVNGIDSQSTVWNVSFNLTPRITYYQNYTSQSKPSGDPCPTSDFGPVLNLDTFCLIPNNIYNYTGTDLTLTVIKNNTKTLSDFTLYKGITTGNTLCCRSSRQHLWHRFQYPEYPCHLVFESRCIW